MLEPIDAMCRVWGIQKRRIITGTTAGGHEDGWPQATILEKIREMQENAGGDVVQRSQKFAEVYTARDALLVHRTMEGMPEELVAALFVRYVIPQSHRNNSRKKATMIDQSVNVYFDNIDRAHHWIAARLDAVKRPHLAEVG